MNRRSLQNSFKGVATRLLRLWAGVTRRHARTMERIAALVEERFQANSDNIPTGNDTVGNAPASSPTSGEKQSGSEQSGQAPEHWREDIRHGDAPAHWLEHLQQRGLEEGFLHAQLPELPSHAPSDAVAEASPDPPAAPAGTGPSPSAEDARAAPEEPSAERSPGRPLTDHETQVEDQHPDESPTPEPPQITAEHSSRQHKSTHRGESAGPKERTGRHRKGSSSSKKHVMRLRPSQSTEEIHTPEQPSTPSADHLREDASHSRPSETPIQTSTPDHAESPVDSVTGLPQKNRGQYADHRPAKASPPMGKPSLPQNIRGRHRHAGADQEGDNPPHSSLQEPAPGADSRNALRRMPDGSSEQSTPPSKTVEPVPHRWPTLLDEAPQETDPDEAAETVETALRTLKRQQRLDREQRGDPWNE